MLLDFFQFLSLQKDNLEKMNNLNQKIEEYKDQLSNQEKETRKLLTELENQKQLNSKSPTQEVKSIVEKLKQQLAEKDEQQRVLNQALVELKSDMVSMARNNLTALNQSESSSHEKKWQEMIEKTSSEYQDKIFSMGEELVKMKKELKDKTKSNDELKLECDYLKSQIKTKDQRIKKLSDDSQKLKNDFNTTKITSSTSLNAKSNDVDYLRRQLRILEEKLKKEKLNKAERPYDQGSRSRVIFIIIIK